MTNTPKPAETRERKGHCLCGDVQITAHQASTEVGACHCHMCRRWGGGPAFELDCGTDVTITGEDHIAVYNSSEWAERAFCTTCGTNLYYRLKEPGQYMIASAIFDNEDGLNFTTQVYIDSKPDYYSLAEQTKNLTGAEVEAMFAAEMQ
jgi:hypothetical protein